MKVTLDKANKMLDIDCTDDCDPMASSHGPGSTLKINEWRCLALAMWRIGWYKLVPIDFSNDVISLELSDRTRTIIATVKLINNETARIKLRYDGSR